MYRNLKIAATLSIIFLSFCAAQAQDIIYRKNGKTIAAKIVEINPDDVKYKMFDQQSGATFTIDINLVKKIVFENGTVHNFSKEEASIDNPELYIDQKRTAYKISFLDPLFGHTSFIYERNLKPGKSIEGRLNVIGLGRTNNNNNYTYNNTTIKPKPFGLGLTVGYKFYHKPDYYTSRQRYAHLLKGGYIRPEINLTSYAENKVSYSYNGTTSAAISQRVTTTFGVAMLTFGKQWILDDAFAIDLFAGVGIGLISRGKVSTGNGSYTEVNFNSSNYGHVIADNGLAMNFGFNIGFLGK